MQAVPWLRNKVNNIGSYELLLRSPCARVSCIAKFYQNEAPAHHLPCAWAATNARAPPLLQAVRTAATTHTLHLK